MLLRDSEVARQVRAYLLDAEYLARTQPVDNSVPTSPAPADALDDRIDRRITDILGKSVVPMFNASSNPRANSARSSSPCATTSSGSSASSSSTTYGWYGWSVCGGSAD
ncbi:hypothetical protein [Streptomyces albidochromogenes]|uniref:hypothetical protein n=1 Tax=Streptomyces albidochromogenes TaxID=329524 RepID=UPI001FCADD38|nr:hypothetical protein [Streptomyces albidochromogenes]